MATPGAKLQPFLRRIFMQGSLPNPTAPSMQDVKIAMLTIEGKEMHEVMAAESIRSDEVIASVKRVRDAIRMGRAPEEVFRKHSDLVEWQLEKYKFVARTTGPLKGPKLPVGEANPLQAGGAPGPSPAPDSIPGVSAIMTGAYDEPDPDDPSTFQRLIDQVRARASVPMMKALATSICQRLATGEVAAIRMALDFMGISKRPAMVSQRGGITPDPEGRAPSASGRSFEAVLKRVAAQSSDGFGVGSQTATLEAEIEGDDEEDEE